MGNREHSRLRRAWRALFGPGLAAALSAFLVLGCSAALRDRAVVWTEQGLTAAELQWDDAFHERLKHCRNAHPPRTPAAEQCFGAWYDADRDVDVAVRAAVAVLRTYWTARAAGESDPAWSETQARVAQIVADLPPLPREYFERIKGLP